MAKKTRCKAANPLSFSGTTCDAYHDGKVSPCRLARVKIDHVVKITRLNKKLLRRWKKAIDQDFRESLLDGSVVYIDGGPQRFWDWNCDTFLFGHMPGSEETEKEPMMFARGGARDLVRS